MQKELEARANDASVHHTARVLLETYLYLLRDSLARLKNVFTLEEAQMIFASSNGTLWEVHTAPLLWANVEDSHRYDGTGDEWGVDVPVLVEKLKGLNHLQCMALVDAIQRWYAQPEKQLTAKGFADVGLFCQTA